jgi:hypothetical protein
LWVAGRDSLQSGGDAIEALASQIAVKIAELVRR